MAAETARINLAMPSYRFEDLQCLTTLFGRYRHPYGCEHHVFIPLKARIALGLLFAFSKLDHSTKAREDCGVVVEAGPDKLNICPDDEPRRHCVIIERLKPLLVSDVRKG